jgi:hypothetical protein
MQNTQDSETCHLVRFDTEAIGLAAKSSDGSCGVGLSATSGDVDDFLLVDVEDTYTAKDASGSIISSITFNDLGQPVPGSGSCATTGCVIEFSSERSVCIESQGYIHVCP